MILTVTPNPSMDATLQLTGNLEVDGVNRATSVTSTAGGKGVNVARVAHLAGHPVTALFPASANDPFLRLVDATGIAYDTVDIDDDIRVNTTLTSPDGTTTKVNGPGPELSRDQWTTLIAKSAQLAASAQAVVLAGSLPPGVPDDFYTQVLESLNDDVLTAVDTSDTPLKVLAENFHRAAPTIIKPNGFELGQLSGADGMELERAAEDGDFTPVLTAGRAVVAQGVAEVLVTLGGAGAVLISSSGAWHATPPPVSVKSTVGAGDSSLTGYLLSRLSGDEPPEALRTAVAYGTAAAGLPGTDLPSPEQLDRDGVTVSPVT